MKKFISLALSAFAACTTFALTSCNAGKKYVATDIAAESNEEYAFAIGKNATKKTEILNAMNKVIDEIDVAKIVEYYKCFLLQVKQLFPFHSRI